jgi:cytoskeletal protein CcmA (bactofilin family)
MEKGTGKTLLTMIGEGAVFEGVLTVPHSIRIDGTLKGKLETSETVTIGASGMVEADIIARNAIVGGTIVGNVTVSERVELESHASLTGDLKTKTLVINEGAAFKGKSVMGNGASGTSAAE